MRAGGKRLFGDPLFQRAKADRMAGWPSAEGVSGSLFEGGLTGLLPLERRQLVDFPIGGARQSFQHVFEPKRRY